MKPVNLLPGDVAVASANAGKPNVGMIGGAVVGLLAIAVVGGYFAMARVDTVKSEKAAAEQAAADATAKAAAVNSQVASLGQPVVDSDKQLAQGAEQVLVSAYTERHDFVLLAQELRAIMDPSGWYVSIKATSIGSDDGGGAGVTIIGYLPTKELMAAFNERAKATKTLADAVTVTVESETLRDIDTRRPGRYYKFTMKAKLVDTIAPRMDGGGADVGGGLTVASGGGTGELGLSLESKPKPSASSGKPAKPKNPFDVAATVAGGGA